MSHLACASDPTHPLNHEQLSKTQEIQKLFPDTKISLANSSGCLLGKDYHFDIVRPGCGLYGVNPRKVADIKNTITLKAKVIQIREVDSPCTVGYGATAEVDPGTLLATVPVGYADGYLRSLSGKAQAIVAGVTVPVIGIVSMDMITLDITKVSRDKLHNDMEVEIIGENCPVDLLAHWSNTIGYEILTSLGGRYKRIYAD